MTRTAGNRPAPHGRRSAVTRHRGTGPVVDSIAGPVHTGRTVRVEVSTRIGSNINRKILVVRAASRSVNTRYQTVAIVALGVIRVGISVGRVAALDTRLPTRKRTRRSHILVALTAADRRTPARRRHAVVTHDRATGRGTARIGATGTTTLVIDILLNVLPVAE